MFTSNELLGTDCERNYWNNAPATANDKVGRTYENSGGKNGGKTGPWRYKMYVGSDYIHVYLKVVDSKVVKGSCLFLQAGSCVLSLSHRSLPNNGADPVK